jgi:hypothetical protein
LKQVCIRLLLHSHHSPRVDLSRCGQRQDAKDREYSVSLVALAFWSLVRLFVCLLIVLARVVYDRWTCHFCALTMTITLHPRMLQDIPRDVPLPKTLLPCSMLIAKRVCISVEWSSHFLCDLRLSVRHWQQLLVRVYF